MKAYVEEIFKLTKQELCEKFGSGNGLGKGLLMVSDMTGLQAMWLAGLAFVPTLIIQLVRGIKEFYTTSIMTH